MSDALAALQSSVASLRQVVARLEPEQLVRPAYPSEWTIADVLSHLGSGAVILANWLESGLAGSPIDESFAPKVWDEWNAKEPGRQAGDVVEVDQTLADRLAATTQAERSGFRLSMEGRDLDFAGFVHERLSEHAVHLWDVRVALDPTATLAPDATAVLIDRLGDPAGAGGKPISGAGPFTLATNDPARRLSLTVGPDEVRLTGADAGGASGAGDVELPAEALIRLVYGRLDPDHTPASVRGGEHLDTLRRVFPGF